ncbi:MAG: SemiSWEET transporter [Dehalococcoidia bacterium]|nr:SemiSWEET transporter [Dehalococcoidia bacterium]
MAYEEVLGYVAGALTTFSFVPQVWQLFRLRSAQEISLHFNLMLMTGVTCWMIYGILLDLIPVIIWNAVTLVLASGMLYAKLRYGVWQKAAGKP